MSNKSGIGDNVISLPQGGGAQKGIGETFSPDLFTGTGNFSVPIAVPAGRNGFQPQLGLGYSTGNGNSAFGLGWGISVPGVMRKTNKGIPIYDDEQDTFVLSGAEDLVLIDKTSSTTDGIVHHQWKYRPRTEGLFARIIHHKFTDGKDYWEVKSKDGLTSYYGDPEEQGDQYQLSNPVVADNIFAWKLYKTVDVFENTIVYQYTKVITENKEHSAVQLYLSQIQYMNYDDAGTDKFLCSVKFNYEDRPDAFSEGRAGFEVRTTLRCATIESFTHPKDADLPTGYTANTGGNDVLVKRYDLKYQDEIASLPLNGSSVLSEVQVSGYDAGTGETESMPPLSFGYTEFEPDSRDFFPLEGKALPTQSLATPELELADLDGNGLPDFVEMNGQTVRYWKNLGNGKFSLPQLMKEAPAFSLADPEVQLMDADGDGRIDLVVSKPGLNGYFPLNHEGSWDSQGVKRYKTAPSFSFADPEVKMLDLNGNGITDVLRSGSRFENFYQKSCIEACHTERSRSVKAEGWSGANTSNRGQLDIFPNVNFSNPQIKLADMSGDGLQDIVQVENGSIWYWPNLGHGKWGRRRTMKRKSDVTLSGVEVDSAFLFPAGWDPRRVILGDVLGNGTADLIYLDNGKIHLWINQSGNQWSEKITIKGTPQVYNTDAVRLVDLLGTGVAGLLFTYDAGTSTGSSKGSAYFLDFTKGVKPYVMNTMNNNMGAITKVSYESSVHAWIKDNTNSIVTSSGVEKRPWKTTLPFPVQVVAKTEVIDEISKGKLVTNYHYSHGYWDGYEREFRGFGRVEQTDTETFERYNTVSETTHNIVALTHYSPPTKSINWFHLGGINNADSSDRDRFYEADFSQEYWQVDPNVLERSQSTVDLLKSVEPHDRRDAYRAWRGSKLRTELYAADTDGNFSSALAQKPFTVSEAQFGIRLEGYGVSMESHSERSEGIFFSFSEASRSTNWERGDEPKTSFSFTADFDVYGQAKKQMSIAVPRGKNPLTGNAFTGNDVVTHEGGYPCTSSESTFIYKDETDTYICDRSSEQKSFEIINDGTDSVFELRDKILNQTATKKVLGHSLVYYDGGAYTGTPLGVIENYGVVTRTESLYSTETDIDAAYAERPEIFAEDPNLLEYPSRFDDEWNNNRAGYELKTGGSYEDGFYRIGERKQYDFQTGSGYGLVTAMKDIFDNEATVTFDDYDFLPTKVVNPIGMQTSSEYDYRILQASLVTDANDNQSAFVFSPLGLLKATAVMGKAGDNQGDTLAVPGTVMEYDFNAFYAAKQPIWVKTIQRAFHVNDTNDNGETYTSIEYSDGFGRLLQSRTQAEDVLYTESGLPGDQTAQNSNAIGAIKAEGTPDNVVVNGFKIYNNKGKVVEQFEPHFNCDYAYKSPILTPTLGDVGVARLGQLCQQFFNENGNAGFEDLSLLTNFMNTHTAQSISDTTLWKKELIKHRLVAELPKLITDRDISFGDHSQFHVGEENFSIEAWIYPTAPYGSMSIFGNLKYESTYYSGFDFGLYNNRLTCSLGDGETHAFRMTSVAEVSPNEWNHVAFVRDGNDPANWKLYVNGVETTCIDLYSLQNGNLENKGVDVLKIGSRNGIQPANYFNGYISNARLYKREVTTSELLENTARGMAGIASSKKDLRFDAALLAKDSNGNYVEESAYGVLGSLSGSLEEGCFFNTAWRKLPSVEGTVVVGQKISIFYDVLGRPTQTLNPDGTAQLSVYGTPINLSAPTLQANGRFTVNYKPSPWESYAYDANDLGGDTHPTESAAYSNHWNTPESSEIDTLGRTIKTVQRLETGDTIEMKYQYDIQGRLTQVTDPEDRVNFSYSYATVVTPSEDEVPPEAEALKIWHLDSGTKTQVFDARGALIERLDAKHTQVLLSYTNIGQLLYTWVVEEGEEIRLIGTNFFGGINDKSKNLFGSITISKDESGYQRAFSKDFKGNLTRSNKKVLLDRYFTDAKRFKINWSSMGNEILDPDKFVTEMQYDALNRPTKVTLPGNGTNVRKVVVPTYNRAGALEKVHLSGEEFVKEIAYDAKGQRQLIAFGNGIMNRYSYDPTNFRLLRMKAEKYSFTETTTERSYAYQAGTCRQDLGYEYDLNGNILKKKNRTPDAGIAGTTLGTDGLDHNYTYDAISRLLSATGRESDQNKEEYRWVDAPKAGSPNSSNTQSYTRTYEYDKVGNINKLQQTGSNAFTRNFNYTVNKLDGIAVGEEPPTPFEYDANGNLTQSGESKFYEWNEKDQLVFFKVQAGEEASVYAHYLYNSGGDRVKKVVWDQQGNKEVTVYIDGVFEYRLKQEDGEDKEQNIIHVMDDAARIAQVRVGARFNDDMGEEVTYTLDDHLGSSNTRLNDSGAIIDHQEYYPFGDTSLRTYNKKRYQYVGKEKDAESGLIYYGARYYAAWTCRFISVDPIAADYPNYTPYQYAGNKPINFIDLDGLEESPPPAKTANRDWMLKTDRDGFWGGVANIFSGVYNVVMGTAGALMEVAGQMEYGDKVTNQQEAFPLTANQNFADLATSLLTALPLAAGKFYNNPTTGNFGELLGTGLLYSSLFAKMKQTAAKVKPVEIAVEIPYKPFKAKQSTSDLAVATRAAVSEGATLYKIGTKGTSKPGAESQYWSTTDPRIDPTTYAKENGISVENINKADFLEIGVLKKDANFVTREAPAAPGAPEGSGGAIEVVTEVGGVDLQPTVIINLDLNLKPAKKP